MEGVRILADSIEYLGDYAGEYQYSNHLGRMLIKPGDYIKFSVSKDVDPFALAELVSRWSDEFLLKYVEVKGWDINIDTWHPEVNTLTMKAIKIRRGF